MDNYKAEFNWVDAEGVQHTEQFNTDENRWVGEVVRRLQTTVGGDVGRVLDIHVENTGPYAEPGPPNG